MVSEERDVRSGLGARDNVFCRETTAGAVASMNQSMSRFYSRAYRNPAGSRSVPKIGDFVKDAFQTFHKLHGCFPESVIIFRDGLSDSQMKPVLDDENKRIEAILREGNVPVLEIIFVVVQKRIDTRFFQNGANVSSGTVVDKGVVASNGRHAEMGTMCDFFLVGQSHLQGPKLAAGTMNPVHYWVRHSNPNDERATTIDELQVLAYKLCHLFYNWNGTISAPALCKYARVLASLFARVKQGDGDFHQFLHNKLSYL